MEGESSASKTTQQCVGLLYDEKMCKHHTPKNHVNLISNTSSNQIVLLRNRIVSKFNSIYFNEGSLEAAFLAAASSIVQPELEINEILIVDWDAHHGNGTQKTFWKNSRVLFFSVHRHELVTFYPANDDGFCPMVGEGTGVGYNINVPWENGSCSDADYLAVWDHILLPVAKEFEPDKIIISAGFDAAAGDPLGGRPVTPYGYAIMLKKLMDIAKSKIVLALEGGNNADSTSNSVLECMKYLLEYKPVAGSSESYPFESTWRLIQAVRHKLSPFRPTLEDELPKKLTGLKAPPPDTSSSSGSKDEDIVSEKLGSVLQDILAKPLSKLKVQFGQAGVGGATSWRSVCSKIHVWYATFGSNMWKQRFLCYIEGGQVEGMKKACAGSKDRTLPKEILWKTFPHRLFFGGESTSTWGPGGVAFLDPESNAQHKAHLLLYRITLEQFIDVLVQENFSGYATSSTCSDINDKQSFSLEELKTARYYNVLYLGKERDVPILTITCSLSDVEKYKSGELIFCSPATAYANTLIKGLVEGEKLSHEEAMTYIHEASTKPL